MTKTEYFCGLLKQLNSIQPHLKFIWKKDSKIGESTRKYLNFDQKWLNNPSLGSKEITSRDLLWRKCIDKLCFYGCSKQLVVHAKLMITKMQFNINAVESVTIFNFVNNVTHCLAIDCKNIVVIYLKNVQ